MTALTEIRRISIEASASGVDTATAQLQKLSTSMDGVAVASSTMTKETLSAQPALDRLRMSIDAEFRAMTQLERAQKTIALGYQQGLLGITGTSAAMAEQSRLLELAAQRYSAAGHESKGFFASLGFGEGGVKSLLGGLGIGLGMSELIKVPGEIGDIVHEAAGLGHVADAIGITTDRLQELNYAGSVFHVSTEDMDAALMKFSKNLGMAAAGTGDLGKLLAMNHIAITGDFTRDFNSVANLIERATNAEQRNLIVTTAFGKGAEALGPMFEYGADGIQRAADEIERMGGVVNRFTLADMAKIDKDFNALSTTIGVTFKRAVLASADAVSYLLDAMRQVDQQTNMKRLTDELDIVHGQLDQLYSQSYGIPAVRSLFGMPSADEDIAAKSKALHAQESAILNRIGELNAAASAAKESAESSRGGSGGGGVDTNLAAAQHAEELAKAFDSAMQSARKETAALQAQYAAIGLGVGAAAALEMRQKLLTAADEDHVAKTPKLLASIDAQAKAYGDLKQQIAELTALKQLQFERQLIGLSETEKSIAQQLHQIYGDNWQNEMNGAVASTMRLNATLQTTYDMAQSFGDTFLADMQNGKSAMDALKDAALQLFNQLEKMALNAAINSMFSSLLSALGLSGSTPTVALGALYANGGAFDTGGNVIPFANGGIVGSPTLFRFAQGTGLMGEAGPEAIMPLKRGANGQLGVQMVAAGKAAGPVINVYPVAGTTADVKTNTDGSIDVIMRAVDAKFTAERRAWRNALPDMHAKMHQSPRQRGEGVFAGLLP
jgi:lambda family phage tail tape measure protein